MSRVCSICSKRPITGNQISKSFRHTKRPLASKSSAGSGSNGGRHAADSRLHEMSEESEKCPKLYQECRALHSAAHSVARFSPISPHCDDDRLDLGHADDALYAFQLPNRFHDSIELLSPCYVYCEVVSSCRVKMNSRGLEGSTADVHFVLCDSGRNFTEHSGMIAAFDEDFDRVDFRWAGFRCRRSTFQSI